MTWTFEHPLLYCLPVIICLLIHVCLSAAFIVGAKPGGFRVFLYFTSSLFLLAYFFLFNHCVTLATTKIEINFPGKFLRYQNQYGALRITEEDLQEIVVLKGPRTAETVWIVSRRQTFYLDQNFRRHREFLPLLGAFYSLPEPVIEGNCIRYILAADRAEKDPALSITSGINVLGGSSRKYIPLMLLFTCFAYFWGQRGWQGNLRYFQGLALIYTLPALVLALIWPPPLAAAAFLVCYPFYPVFLTALFNPP